MQHEDPGESRERRRLREQGTDFKRWGPYLSERQWGTVREDYSEWGDAWGYFPHRHARSRAYRWGEDGIAGFSDDKSRFCFSLGLWNGKDTILKERLFGLTNPEGNHGEDVKELYYYLDATPTHSYLKMLYKYPQARYPYDELRERNAERGKLDPEFELLDTGLFDERRYFDVFVEFAQLEPGQVFARIRAVNRGPAAAALHLLPQVAFRNTWDWGPDVKKPWLEDLGAGRARAHHPELGPLHFDVEGAPPLLLCENETNPSIWGHRGLPGRTYKDGFHEFVVKGRRDAVKFGCGALGTKAAAHVMRVLGPGKEMVVHARFGLGHPVDAATQVPVASRIEEIDSAIDARRAEADEFYAELQAKTPDADLRGIQRQALAGMVWTKQFYYWDIPAWFSGDPEHPPPPATRTRNKDWEHLNNADIISMPDTWEYPWYAAWDLAFHCIPFTLIDSEFAKHQLELLTKEWYMHPNGQLPAYEWALSDVNPPVHAWASWRVFQIDRAQRGDAGDLKFLERIFHKLLLNFTWWVNRKDDDGNNVFQGGFLGLDNIGIFDRSQALPMGGKIEQADGTGWMAMYSLNMLRIAIELSEHNDTYEHIASKFFEHYLYIARAMMETSGPGLWDEEDRFYYDWLDLTELDPKDRARIESLQPGSSESKPGERFAIPDLEETRPSLITEALRRITDTTNVDHRMERTGERHVPITRVRDHTKLALKVRSIVGLIPLFAVEVLEPQMLARHPDFAKRVEWFLDYRPDLRALISEWEVEGVGHRRLLSLLRGSRLKALLKRMVDETEFLSPYGVRAMSRHHEESPYRLELNGEIHEVAYAPAESTSNLFGGNSNWRGPIWFPINYLIVESLQHFHHYYGDDFKVECPTGSGQMCTLLEVSEEISRRLVGIFRRGEDGTRAVYGDSEIQQHDPHFRDLLLFYEYFDGNVGRGVGAAHQTGWTGLVAKLIHPRRPIRRAPEDLDPPTS